MQDLKPILVVFAVMTMLDAHSFAEPYLAVREGLACSSCHVNPGGGGKRTRFGTIYAQTELTREPIVQPEWIGEVADKLSIGGNARYSAQYSDIDERDNNSRFETDRVGLYIEVKPIERLTLYVDQQLAPNNSVNRETWARVKWSDAVYVKAGKLFLPYGWRLEDDSALIRSATGINFSNADNGIEVGMEQGKLNLQFAVTNGSPGSTETDKGKQASLRVARLERNYRVGFSSNFNDTAEGERSMLGVFGGFRTGALSWLLEWDFIKDNADVVDIADHVALIEANWLASRGHNLKFTGEALWPDADNAEDLFRLSTVWEYFPMPFTRLRVGLRINETDDTREELDAEDVFVQLHAFF